MAMREGSRFVVAFLVAACVSSKAFAKLPPQGAWILGVSGTGVFGSDDDFQDLYGGGLTGGDGGRIFTSHLGIGYTFTPKFQMEAAFGGLFKALTVVDSVGITEDWALSVNAFELRARTMFGEGPGKISWGLGGGVGTYSLDGTYKGSFVGFIGNLDLTGSSFGGWLEFGPEWRWTHFSLGVTGAYRFLRFDPVKAEGTILRFVIPNGNLLALSGDDAHFDFSGFSLGVSLRWYLGAIID